MIIYWSSLSRNTERFCLALDRPVVPLREYIKCPYILVTPTVGDGDVPDLVSEFLSQHHAPMIGVIAGGNRNFGKTYGGAGNNIAATYGVPLLYKFELFGTETDTENVRKIYDDYCLH